MIKSIYVKNFVLIDELSLDLNEHFSCFTGETGAGKSLLIDAISLLCGERISTQYIKANKEKVFIEALVEISSLNHPSKILLEENGFALDENCFTISRECTIEGKSNAKINGRNATLSFVKEVMSKLVDIHSQHDNQYLLNNKYHLKLLDDYIGNDILLKEVKDLYKKYDAKRKEIELFESTKANVEDLEFLQFQLHEINALALEKNEIEDLENRQKELASFEKISSSLANAISTIENSKYDSLYQIKRMLDSFDNEIITTAKEEIVNAYFTIDEQLSNIKDYVSNLSFDEKEYDFIQSRLYEIHKVLRKYGNTYDSMQEKKQEIESRILAIENRQEYLDTQYKELESLKSIYYEKAKQLSDLRKNKALELEKDIICELNDLHLNKARFKIDFNETFNANGIDNVEFMVSMNPGGTLNPLIKVASGGELSRLMLGLKIIFNKLQKIETVIFDEIDNGVSGTVAYAIGKKMYALATNAQVFSVTHLANVAVWANYHYLVEKLQSNNTTTSKIQLLDEENTIKQLTSISYGIISDNTLSASKEMYNACKEEKLGL